MKKKSVIFISCLIIVLIVIVGIFYFKNYRQNSTGKILIEQESTPTLEVVQEQNTENTQQSNDNNANEIAFDEEDLKEKLGIYLAYENFMNDYFIPEQELENANIVDYANEAKVFIGYFLVYYSKFDNNYASDNKPTEEEVRKAVEEFCGEHYEKYIDTTEYWLAFDGDNAYEFVEAGDYTPFGYCNSIESITEEDGKYTVTFIYSRPGEDDYLEDNLDNIQKYRKSMTFIYHEDAIYTKYQLTELSFLKGEEV